jgi:hypothetical protein
LRKANLISKLLSILKSMAIAVSLRPLFARKFGNIELMSILPAGWQDSPGKNTNPALDQCRWGIQACKHYIATLFLGRPKRNLTLDHQAREKREDCLQVS